MGVIDFASSQEETAKAEIEIIPEPTALQRLRQSIGEPGSHQRRAFALEVVTSVALAIVLAEIVLNLTGSAVAALAVVLFELVLRPITRWIVAEVARRNATPPEDINESGSGI